MGFSSPSCLYHIIPRKNGAVSGSIFQSLSTSLHHFTKNLTAPASEKQKSMWDSISHICFLFLQETAHKRSKYYHICSVTKYVGPSVKLPCSDSDVIPHRRLSDWSYQILDKREGCAPLHAMVFIQQAPKRFENTVYPPVTTLKQPNDKALPPNLINSPNSDYKALISYDGREMNLEGTVFFTSEKYLKYHRSSSELLTSLLTHN